MWVIGDNMISSMKVVLAGIVLLGGASGAARAASCSCTYSEPTCAASITCPGAANCSCTVNGCIATCGSASGGMELARPITNFSGSGVSPSALVDWHAGLPSDASNWTMSIGFSTTQRRTVAWTSQTFEQLLEAWAAEFNACVDIDASAMTIDFKATGTCD